ncbi:MAG: hypothetical protein ABI591_27365 [Kofleriaceae bacterium]
MIRRHVLAALATGVEAGDDDAARAALAHTEWPLRGSARRELERALIDAALISRAMITHADANEMRHVQRVAALSLAGHYEVDATRRDDVTDAYAKLPPPRPPSAPIATILLACGAALGVGLLVWAAIVLRTPTPRVRNAPPMPWGAFATGGTPLADHGIEHLLADDLPNFVIETDDDRHGAPVEARVRAAYGDELRTSKVIAAYGPALTRAWIELIDALDNWADAPTHTRGFHEARERLRAAAQAVSDQFAAVGVGYHLEADVFSERGAAHGTVFTYRIEDIVYVRAGGEPRRVLSLRRLDRINVTHNVLGMQTEELGDPVVMLDQIDDFVAQRFARAAFVDRFTVGDDSFVRTGPGNDLASAAGHAISRELATLDFNTVEITKAVVATVRRHEARHGYDNDLSEPLRYPTALAHELGDGQRAFVQRARAELSAYLSQIASDPVTPQLALWNLAQLGFNKERWGSAESYVAVVVISGLARQLGIRSPGNVIHDGHLDRNRLAELALPLAAESDDDLRTAARRLWRQLYDQPFIAIVGS